mgnify:CR=1 FL=1
MEFKLRKWEISDQDSLVKYANNFEISKNLTDAFPHPYTIDDAARFIEMATKAHPNHIFAIEVNGEAVGGIGIHPQTDINRKNAELGYWLGQPFWGNGIISKAIPEVVKYGFDTFDIQRIYARPYGHNIASQKVLEKNGFTLEAHIKQNLYKNDEFVDELIYAIRRKK